MKIKNIDEIAKYLLISSSLGSFVEETNLVLKLNINVRELIIKLSTIDSPILFTKYLPKEFFSGLEKTVEGTESSCPE
ncbi:hypothetical protein [Leptospira levettii]|uniref:hypothetical protein n=1 Tax=Leptospira levettii TaxID=2023178 RepID=UPI001FED3B53|nr:hypothetical protein [Leptospira levettii]